MKIKNEKVVMASVRSVKIKLVDLRCEKRVSKLGKIVEKEGENEY
jgi:hypothetical protein